MSQTNKLKSIFSLSFKGNDVSSLIISILLYLGIGVVLGLVCWLVGIIPLIGGPVSWLIGTVGGLYVPVGIVLAVLHFLKIV